MLKKRESFGFSKVIVDVYDDYFKLHQLIDMSSQTGYFDFDRYFNTPELRAILYDVVVSAFTSDDYLRCHSIWVRDTERRCELKFYGEDEIDTFFTFHVNKKLYYSGSIRKLSYDITDEDIQDILDICFNKFEEADYNSIQDTKERRALNVEDNIIVNKLIKGKGWKLIDAENSAVDELTEKLRRVRLYD